MTSKEWLLNPIAIRKAKECIFLIEKELAVRLKLTHPNFLEMIKDYAELTGSSDLQTAYIQLARMAGIEDESVVIKQQKVVNLPHVDKRPIPISQDISQVDTYAVASGGDSGSSKQEIVTYQGKSYPKYNELGQTFKSLYRGQPCYR